MGKYPGDGGNTCNVLVVNTEYNIVVFSKWCFALYNVSVHGNVLFYFILY